MTTVAEVQFFEFDGGRLAYRKYGSGPTALLAFHGFGQDSQIYLPLEKSVGDLYSIYAIDLIFHGSSTYADHELLTKRDWQRLIDNFLRTQSVQQFSLVGFSLGGRFALSAAESFPLRLNQLILIAPDGITQSVWYRLATGSGIGRWLFRYVLKHLSVLSYIGIGLTKLGLLNRTAMRFAELSLGTPEQRNLVYKSWTRFRLITPDLGNISVLLNQQQVPVYFFVGTFDRIIPAHYILPLTKKLMHFEVTVLKTGHNHLIDLAANHLTERSFQHMPKPGNGNKD
jgi:pimeloyl-ACP methyl ester carboxylesterase